MTRTLHLPLTSDADVFELTVRAHEGVVVVIESPGAERRGKLDAHVVECVESELQRLGAAPAGWREDEPLAAKLADQLYRLRWLGSGGLGLRFSSLARLADGAGQLGLEDSYTLRSLFSIAERDRLQIYLPEEAAALRVVGAPEHLSGWLSAGSRAGRVASIEYEPLPATAAAALEAPETTPEPVALPSAALVTEPAPADVEVEPAPGVTTPNAEPRNLITVPHDPERERRCESWAAQLSTMSGPKVHLSVERAFVTAYVPLRRELALGNAPDDIRGVVDGWAEGFAQSYASAFKGMGSRAKRPKMVKDIIELGTRWLSQHRARQCQLLLVEGMRFDLGQRLNEQIELRLARRAVCAEQALLWAALPSNAETQQIGEHRVPSSRRASKPSRTSALAELNAGPRGVENVRLGSREIFRVDQLTAELTQPGEAEAPRLERLAASLAEVIVPWMREQPADTLVVVFGDHGFHWSASPRGTTAAHQGGALPEQVLVPASAWLLADQRPGPGTSPGLH